MPAYNEEKNIGTVIEQWYPVVERIGGDSRLVILNDGSKDATYKKIQNYQKNYDRLIGIDKPNEGHGGTILRGYRYAVEKGADYIFQTDSDGQTLPEEFWQFWEKRQKCGLLIGYRKKPRLFSAKPSATRAALYSTSRSLHALLTRMGCLSSLTTPSLRLSTAAHSNGVPTSLPTVLPSIWMVRLHR